MIFYASGAITDEVTLELVVRHRIAILTSYAYKTALKKQMPILSRMLREQGVKLHYMVDSGAFTAWNKGKEVRRASLIDFYNQLADEYSDCCEYTFVSLDRIPGRQGVPRTADDFIVAAEETVRNYEFMVKAVNGYIKPVYHDGEADWVLRAYDNAPYISLSANQDLTHQQREAWVAETVKKVGPKRQLHGLAMTGTRMLRTTRWCSVDSASWVYWGAMGAIAWLRDDGSLKLLPASAESPRAKDQDQHLANLPPIVRDRILTAMEAEGFTEEMIRKDGVTRARWNMLVFNSACAWAAKQSLVAPRIQGGLFDA